MHSPHLRLGAAATCLALIVAACTDSPSITSPTTAPPNVQPSIAVSIGENAPPGATVAIAVAEAESIAAHHALTPAALDVASLLHTGLTRRGANGLAEPGLAATWSTLDQRTWTFNLHPNLTFNDGTPVSAQSFVDSWQTLATQDTRSRNAYLGLVAGVGGWGEVLSGEEGRMIAARAIDQLSLQVQLDQPFPWFAELVAHPAFAPVAASELAQPDAFAPVGTGPFRIAEPWDPGEVLKLARVWGGGEPGSVSTFEIHLTSSDAEAAALLDDGTVELAVLGDAPVPGGADEVELPTDALVYMGFPVSRPPTDEAFIRQALVHAIDRESMASATAGVSIVHDEYAPPHAAGANLLLCTRCVHDPDTARELLAEVEPPENSLSLHVVEGSAGEPWADAIASMWTSELGWPVAVVRHDLAGLIGFLQSGVPDGPFILEWSSEYPAAESWIEPLFDRAGIDDFTRFSDRNIANALDELDSQPPTSPSRTSVLKDIRTVLAERVPTIPLAVTTRRVGVSDSIVAESLDAGPHLGLDGLLWRP